MTLILPTAPEGRRRAGLYCPRHLAAPEVRRGLACLPNTLGGKDRRRNAGRGLPRPPRGASAKEEQVPGLSGRGKTAPCFNHRPRPEHGCLPDQPATCSRRGDGGAGPGPVFHGPDRCRIFGNLLAENIPEDNRTRGTRADLRCGPQGLPHEKRSLTHCRRSSIMDLVRRAGNHRAITCETKALPRRRGEWSRLPGRRDARDVGRKPV